MQVTVNISDEILKWVMSHIRIDTLPDNIIEYLNLWRTKEKEPTFNQVEKVSNATGIPFGYFFLQSPPSEDLSLVDYRTVDSIELTNPSRNLIDTMHNMEQIQEWVHEYLLSEGALPLDFIGELKDENRPDIFAARMRSILDIDIDWYKRGKSSEDSFKLLRYAMNEAGILVMVSGIVGNNTHRSLDINEFRAFAMEDKYAPLIFINSNDSFNGRLFSLLHEFAHLCMGQNSFFNDRYSTASKVNQSETICNAAAAEILVPQETFIMSWRSVSQENNLKDTIIKLSRMFRCGTTVIARKAYDNRYINIALYREIARQAVEKYNEFQSNKKESGGSFYNTAAFKFDNRFFRMLTNSVHEGKTLYSDAFRLTNTNRKTFFIHPAQKCHIFL